MKGTLVQVPVALLRDPELSLSAKLLWMVLRLPADPASVGPALLEARSGLSRPTVLKGLAQLDAAGWRAGAEAAVDSQVWGDTVTLPDDLLLDRRVGAQAKVLYGLLQSTPAFNGQSGQFSYAALRGMSGRAVSTVRQAVQQLAATGWLRTTQANQLAPIQFVLSDPHLARGKSDVEAAQRRLDRAPFLGEAIMREYLSLLVDSELFEDDAAPGFLENPLTRERLELDRFYPPSVAFEFQGPQHYGPTARYSEEEALKQRGRDYMKLGICVSRGITLVVVHAEDLSLQTMGQKVSGLLPLRDLKGSELLIAFLEKVSRRYRLAARRGR